MTDDIEERCAVIVFATADHEQLRQIFAGMPKCEAQALLWTMTRELAEAAQFHYDAAELHAMATAKLDLLRLSLG